MKSNATLIAAILIIIGVIMLGIALFSNDNSEEVPYYCSEESRNVDACTEIYQPVCGWFDPDKVQCIKYPCAQTFGNSCFACQNSDILYYTLGECP